MRMASSIGGNRNPKLRGDIQLGMKTKFRQKDNPLPWLDWVLNGASHDNFFEKRVTEYSVVGMEGDWGWEEEPEVCGLDGVGCAA